MLLMLVRLGGNGYLPKSRALPLSAGTKIIGASGLLTGHLVLRYTLLEPTASATPSQRVTSS